jgi:hypothetical protein
MVIATTLLMLGALVAFDRTAMGTASAQPLARLGATPPPAPKWSKSRYMETADPAVTYDLGCDMGNGVDGGVRPTNAVVVLDYGMAVPVKGAPWGASLWNGPDTGTSAIRRSAQEFAHGYWACSDGNSSQLTLAIGTSNYGPNVVYDHGKAWGAMINKANQTLRAQGWSSQVVMVGAIDLELSWSSPDVATQWLDGYDKGSNWRILNFGDAAGCPPATNSCGTSGHPEWTQHDVWFVSWGHHSSYPLPEIYRTDGIMAEQWHRVAHRGLELGDSLMEFSGAMTQAGACKQRGCDPSTMNSPQQGWSQLWTALNGGDGTDQTPAWSTDISWKNG